VHPVTIETARLAGRIGSAQAVRGVTIALQGLLVAATARGLLFVLE
jgi:predicted nucleic acid-binding protein